MNTRNLQQVIRSIPTSDGVTAVTCAAAVRNG